MSFADLGLSDELLRAVADSGYGEPTPIQRGAIPSVLMGKDLVGIAQTGTGKTAGFVLPMIDILAQGRSRARMPRSLILEPTRELAAQVAENFEKYGKYHKLSMALLIGGVQMGDQVKALEKGVDVLIATPGPADGPVRPRQDPAQRLRAAGHRRSRPDARHGLHPGHRGNLLEAAEVAPDPAVLGDHAAADPEARGQVPQRAQADRGRPARRPPTSTSSSGWSRSAPTRRSDALRDILRHEEFKNAIVFCNRKTTVRELATSLKRSGFAVGQIHGDMDQSDRIAEFDRFKNGRDQHPRRLRRRGARARRQRRQPRDQLRRAVAARRLHPPHRPHRPRRDEGHRHHARDPRGRRSGRRDRETDRPQDRPRRRQPGDPAEAREPREARPPRDSRKPREAARKPREPRLAPAPPRAHRAATKPAERSRARRRKPKRSASRARRAATRAAATGSRRARRRLERPDAELPLRSAPTSSGSAPGTASRARPAAARAIASRRPCISRW